MKDDQKTACRPPSELLDDLDAIVWVLELPSKRFLYVNQKAQELLGYSADRSSCNAPEFWAERIHPEDRAWVVESYDRALENRTQQSCEYRAQTSDGRVVWLREMARPVFHANGQTKHLIGIAIEVSQRRMLEDQLIRSQRFEALEKLGNQARNQIHDLLTVISGYGEQLLDGFQPSHPLHSDLQAILSAADRLRCLANQLAASSRKPCIAAIPVDLCAVISNIQPMLKSSLGENIELDLKMFPSTISVQADAAHLEQLITVLAQRAGRAMERGTVLIEFSAIEITEKIRRHEKVLRPGGYAVIRVEDTGPTPSPEARAGMFEPIAIRDAKDEDAAILSRIYGFVRQWGGDISVSVNTPQGAVFEIFLRRVGESTGEVSAGDAHTEEQRQLQSDPGPEAAVPEPILETILIVEQDAAIRALLKKILRKQNYAVLEAESSDKALKTAAGHPGKIDLLITDVSAVDGDADKLAQELAAGHSGTRVLYISGYTDDLSAPARGVPAGAPFLQKPFTRGSLLNKVQEVLQIQVK